MKRHLFFLLVLGILTSCSKDELKVNSEEKAISFMAAPLDKGDTKITVVGGKVNWVVGDVVMVTANGNDTRKYVVSDDGKKNNRYATLAPATGVEGFSDATATYTAKYGDVNNQVYDSNCSYLPMESESAISGPGSGGEFIFKFINSCGVVAVEAHTVESTIGEKKYNEVKISRIVLGKRALNFATPTALDGTYWVAVPADEQFNTVTFVNASESAANKSLTSYSSVQRNHKKTLNTGTYFLTATYNNFEPKALNGVFSVSASKKVRFSSGNLYYDGSSWHCESNQYDYRSYQAKNSCISGTVSSTGTPTNHWGMFGWISEGAELATEPFSYGMSTYGSSNLPKYASYNSSTAKYVFTELYKDWGQTTCSKQWFTLLKSEWEYLITTRKVKRGKDAASANGKAYECLFLTNTSHPVLIIFPDDYPGTYDGDNDVASGATISNTVWQYLENKGCVLLPAPGIYRSGASTITYYSSNFKTVIGTPYWTSTYHEEGSYNTNATLSYTMTIIISATYPQTSNITVLTNEPFNKSSGCFIRLVQEITE